MILTVSRELSMILCIFTFGFDLIFSILETGFKDKRTGYLVLFVFMIMRHKYF